MAGAVDPDGSRPRVDMGDLKTTRRARPEPVARAPRDRAGFTVLEGLIAFTALSIAMVGVLSAVVETNSMRAATRQTMLASQAAQSVLDEMSTATFSQVHALYNADPADDPGGAGTAPGSGFAVTGLDPQSGDPDGLVGRIEFPGAPGALREDAVDVGLGMPRDLNADGVVDADDRAADYILLPVRVRVEWLSEGGERVIEFTTNLADL